MNGVWVQQFAAPLRGARFLGSYPRVASATADFTRGYYHSLPPGGKAFNIESVQHRKRSTSKTFNIESVQHRKRSTSKAFNIESVQHRKRSTSKAFNIESNSLTGVKLLKMTAIDL
jgi:hypothetical protein